VQISRKLSACLPLFVGALTFIYHAILMAFLFTPPSALKKGTMITMGACLVASAALLLLVRIKYTRR
jgi:hypothetical protein